MSELIGWRGWRMKRIDEGIFLQSTFKEVVWEEPALSADIVPTKDNKHGIYCLANRDDNEQHLQYSPVFGCIALSGKVIVGEQGYRAEHAVIRSLFLNPPSRGWPPELQDIPSKEIASQLSSRYEVDVEPMPWRFGEQATYENKRDTERRLVKGMEHARVAMEELGRALGTVELVIGKLNDGLVIGYATSWEIRHDVQHRQMYSPPYAVDVYIGTRFTITGRLIDS